MKTIQTPAVITSISSRQDGSLRFSTETPEYLDEEFNEFRKLQGKNVVMTIEPVDEAPDDSITVNAEIDTKTPSQRLRAVLFVLYRQTTTSDDFEAFYRKTMDKVIDQFKQKLS